MIRGRNVCLFLALLVLPLAAVPAAAQEVRLFEGTFEAEITAAYFDPPLFYVLFNAVGGSDPLGYFTIPDGLYIFNSEFFTIPAGLMTFSTPQGDMWGYFEGSGVFTGRFNGLLYIYGGTRVYAGTYGIAELAAQFWLRDFTQGTATFTFIGWTWR
jgi:hypothetical protein